VARERTSVERIISGGQTGADRGGLEAGLAVGVDIGGVCPAGRRAEDGRVPARYPLVEHASSAYPPRTRANVEAADATLVLTLGPPDRGTALTLRLARASGKPCLWLDLSLTTDEDAAGGVVAWLAAARPRTLNVAGSRESSAPGLGERTRRTLVLALSPAGDDE